MKWTKLFFIVPLLAVLSSCNSGGEDVFIPLTVQEAAQAVSASATKYDWTATEGNLIDSILEKDPSINKLERCTYSDFFLLLESAFSSTLPEKTGARLMEGYDNPEDPIYSTYDEDSVYTKAFRMVSDAGLVNAEDFGEDFDANSDISTEEVWALLNRMHYYYGTSKVDDFYAYANYTQRIAFCEDEGTTSEDYLAVSNLIPKANINSWSKETLVADEDSSAFYETFLESHESGDGIDELREYINGFINSTSISGLLDSLINLHKTYGYSPLYDSVEWGFSSIKINDGGSTSIFVPTSSVYLVEDTIEETAEGGSSYLSTIERFTPLFTTLLNNSISGQIWAKHYANFKYLDAVSYDNFSNLENEQVLVTSSLMIGDSGRSLVSVLNSIGYQYSNYWCLENQRAANAFYSLFTSENLDAVKGYCLFQTMKHYLVLLPEETAVNNWIMGTEIEGERVDNDNYFFAYVLPYYANDLVNYYSETQEYKEDVQVVEDLYEELKDALVTKVKSSTWISREGEAKVELKAEKMKYFIGNTSDEADQYDLLQIDYSSLNDSSLMSHIALYENTLWEENVSKVNAGITQDFYYIASNYFPFTANAFYLPARNGICITMGYMAANRRPSLMTDEQLLSHYGWVMGHEIGHGFDAGGFNYDADGKYDKEWMNEDDRNYLTDFSENFASYLNGYESIPGAPLTGTVVLNEALADNIGISLSLAVGKQDEDFSVSSFFLQGARAFGGYITRSYFFQNEYDTNVHPYGRARVNRAFSCFDDFHEAFETQEGDLMFIMESERLVLY